MQLLSLLSVALVLASSHGAFGALPNSRDAIHRRHREHRCKNKSWSHSEPVEQSPAPYNPGSAPVVTPTSYNVGIVKPTTSSTVSTTSSAPTSAPTPANNQNQCGVSSADQASILQYHNDLRTKHGAASLTWNNTLCVYAQNWAKGCNFKHSVVDFGQNLAAGTGTCAFIDAFNAWAAEQSQYNPKNPIHSHYTQLVWKGTQTVACEVYQCAPGSSGSGDPFPESGGSWDYWVCDYYLPGNVEGEFPQNVS